MVLYPEVHVNGVKKKKTCENVTYKGALDHRGYKGTAEEDIRLRVLFSSSAGYNNMTKLLPKEGNST